MQDPPQANPCITPNHNSDFLFTIPQQKKPNLTYYQDVSLEIAAMLLLTPKSATTSHPSPRQLLVLSSISERSLYLYKIHRRSFKLITSIPLQYPVFTLANCPSHQKLFYAGDSQGQIFTYKATREGHLKKLQKFCMPSKLFITKLCSVCPSLLVTVLGKELWFFEPDKRGV